MKSVSCGFDRIAPHPRTGRNTSESNERQLSHQLRYQQPVFFGKDDFDASIPGFTESLPSDLTTVALRQRSIPNCYLIAVFDAILNHPKGRELLASIRWEKKGEHYQVYFPSGRTIKVKDALFQTMHQQRDFLEGPEALQRLEFAYLHMKAVSNRKARRLERKGIEIGPEHLKKVLEQGGQEGRVFYDMFGSSVLVITEYSHFADKAGWHGKILAHIEAQERAAGKKLMHDLKAVSEHPEANLLLAFAPPAWTDSDSVNQFKLKDGTEITYYKPHAYSVRGVDLRGEGHITFVNPHNTAVPDFTLTIDEFRQVFSGYTRIIFKDEHQNYYRWRLKEETFRWWADLFN